jgi:hypothetical protein
MVDQPTSQARRLASSCQLASLRLMTEKRLGGAKLSRRRVKESRCVGAWRSNASWNNDVFPLCVPPLFVPLNAEQGRMVNHSTGSLHPTAGWRAAWNDDDGDARYDAHTCQKRIHTFRHARKFSTSPASGIRRNRPRRANFLVCATGSQLLTRRLDFSLCAPSASES